MPELIDGYNLARIGRSWGVEAWAQLLKMLILEVQNAYIRSAKFLTRLRVNVRVNSPNLNCCGHPQKRKIPYKRESYIIHPNCSTWAPAVETSTDCIMAVMAHAQTMYSVVVEGDMIHSHIYYQTKQL